MENLRKDEGNVVTVCFICEHKETWTGPQKKARLRELIRKSGHGTLAEMLDPDSLADILDPGTLAAMLASSPWKKLGHGTLSDMSRVSKLRTAFGQTPATGGALRGL